MSPKQPFLELPGTLQRFSHEQVLAGTDSMSPARLLGKGGFGPVYLIKEDGALFTRKLAVKVGTNVGEGEAGVGQGRNEFENEALLLWLWQHERIVRLEGVSIGQVIHCACVCKTSMQDENRSRRRVRPCKSRCCLARIIASGRCHPNAVSFD